MSKISESALATPSRSLGKREYAQDSADDDTQNTDSAELRHRKTKIIDQVRRYAFETFDTLRAASKRETDALLEGAKHIALDEEEIRGWEQFCENQLVAMQESAHRLYHEQFMDPLLRELGKTISSRVIQDLDRKFRNEDADYKERESYILSVLPKRIEEWRKVKQRRDALVKDPRFASLTKKQVTGLASFRDEQKFIDLKYNDRKGLTDMVEAAITSMENGTDPMYEKVRTELDGFVEKGIMHHSKVGTWMKRICAESRSPADIKRYMQEVVRPFAENWTAARKEFDKLERAFDTQDVPRGFNRLSPDEFLLQTYTQKTSYLSLAWLSLKDPDGSLEQDKRLAAFKLRIRHDLNTKDWEGAEDELEKAMRVAPDDNELSSMRSYLHSHRPKTSEKKESPDPQKILDELRTIVDSEVPHGFSGVYAKAMMGGPAVFNRLAQLVYNVKWGVERFGKDSVVRHLSYLRSADDNKRGKGFVLDLGEGEGEILQQVNEHADENAGKTPPNLSADEHWGYWGFLISDDVTIDQQCRVSSTCHYRLKSGLRMLHKLGYRFTLAGSLAPLDGTPAKQP